MPTGTERSLWVLRGFNLKNPTYHRVSDKATTQPTCVTSLLEAVLAAAHTYIATLHIKLQPFLKDPIRRALNGASAFSL
jgi:hypothetical protein